MSNSDIYVEALRRLCDSHGGPVGVARQTGVSAENLKQILRGVPLPSGNPRGVGPGLRKTLTEYYPDWVSADHKSDASDRSKRPSFGSNESQVHTLKAQESGKKSRLSRVTPAPLDVEALNWEQLMETVLKEGLNVLKAGVWAEVGDDAMAPDLMPGDLVFFQSGVDPIAQDDVLVRNRDGDLSLRRYRKITSQVFEAWAKNGDGYGTLRSDVDGVEVLAVVMQRTIMRRA